MAIKWSDDLSVGVPEIDMQHRELFAMMNDLLDAIREGKREKVVEGAISFLENYIDKHFSTEENKMIEAKYNGYENHKNEHKKFKTIFEDLKKEVAKDAQNPVLIVFIKTEIMEWILNHVEKEDIKMGEYFKKTNFQINNGGSN